MVRFFTRERFGRPQVLAACLLLVFLAQCLWLVSKGTRPGTVNLAEIYRLQRGTTLWNSRGSRSVADTTVAAPDREKEDFGTDFGTELDPSHQPALEGGVYDEHHSPLWYLIAAAPLWLRPV